MSPSFPAAAERRDCGQRQGPLGNMSPSFPAVRVGSAQTADNGKVRLGNMRPAL